MLRASIDEREDDDIALEAGSVPFVISEEIVTQYGREYAISLDEHGLPVIACGDKPTPCEKPATDCQKPASTR